MEEDVQRFEVFPATASIVLLLIGSGLANFAPNLGWSVHWRGTGYGFSWQMLCYGVATIFCAIATLCSIHRIPFDRAVLQWQFWLSVSCIILFALCQGMFYRMVQTGIPPRVAVPLVTIAKLPSIVIPVFLFAQVLFMAEFARALLRMSSE